ncbi:MAG: ATP synthase F1 subunit delta [Chloroflexota bacterium]|nr:ATP synthase F1 subunit delta [Dehalococcoidia bacterium]MDW8254310.1 ATP synthase F1 subunit delta [Chloroflexota bacterium]
MADLTVARRYAQAIFSLAKDQNRFDEWDAELTTIAEALQQPELRAALESVRAPFAAKRELIQSVFAETVSPLAKNFLLLLVQRGRLQLLDDIIAFYRRLVDEERGIARARVTTAVPLDESERERVAQRLAAITGKQIRLETAVDPTILGGLIARIGDKLIDGSTRTRLLALRQRLAAG